MPESPSPIQEWRILHIDDDEDDYYLIRAMLQQAQGRKIRVDWASTFEAGRQKLFEGYYDAVLVDYDLGVSTGIKIIQEYVAQGGKAPLILFTGRGSREVDLEAMHAGATLYLTKSEVNPLLLERSIRYAIERKETEDALRRARDEALEKEERLKLAQQAGRVGSYEWDMVTNQAIGSDEYEAIHGLQPGESQRIDWRQLVHPEDRSGVFEMIDQAVREQRGEVSGEYRIVRPSGEIRWLENRSAIFYDDSKRPVRMTGVSVDITYRKQAEQALRESEARERERSAEFNAVMDAAPAMIWVTRDPDARVVTGNRAAHDFLRVLPHHNLSKSAPSDEAPRNFRVFQNGKELAPEELPLQIVASTGKALQDFEEEVVFDDGSHAFLLGNVTPLLNEEGQACGAVAVFIDITARKQIEEALRESENRFRALFDNRHSPMLLLDPETGAIVDANPAACSLYGWTRDEMVRMKISDINQLSPNEVQSKLNLAAGNPTSQTFIFRHRMASGQIRDVQVQTGPIFINGKKFLFSIINDITERIQVEDALREAHNRAVWMARFPEENPNPVARISVHGRVLFHNSAASHLEGWNLEVGQIVGEPLMPLIEQALTQSGEVVADIPFGDKIYSVSVMPFPEEDYANLYGRDVTINKQAERALLESEERFRTLANNISQMAWIMDEKGRRSWFNQRWLDYTGLSISEGMEWGWQKTIHPDYLAGALEKINNSLQAGTAWEGTYPIRGKEGQYRWFLTRCIPIPDETGHVLRWFGTNTDITDLQEIEKALQKSEDRFRLAAQAVSGIVYDWDLETDLVYISEGIESLLGVPYQPKEVPNWWPDRIHPQDAPRVQQVFQAVLAGTQTSYEMEYRVQHTNGNWMDVWDRANILRDENGRAVRVVGFASNITARKQAEADLQHYAQELERSNQALEDFTFIASHDLQEPLRKVQTFGQMLSTRFGSELGPVALDYIDRMRKASERMSTMLSGLLDYSRVTTHVQPFQPVDLAPLINDVVQDLEARMMETGGRVTIEPLPVIQADPLQMRQLFQNLIGNALKYHRPGVQPLINITSRSVDPQQVAITIADNGLGLDMQQADYIFQPFTRLNSKFIYEGTGIGLAICRKIIERHGGKIYVESVPDQGSAFTAVLPLHQPD